MWSSNKNIIIGNLKVIHWRLQDNGEFSGLGLSKDEKMLKHLYDKITGTIHYSFFSHNKKVYPLYLTLHIWYLF